MEMESRAIFARVAVLAGFSAASLAASLALFGAGNVRLSSAATSSAATGPDLTALPLGDGKTTTTNPRRGYLYECVKMTTGGGAQQDGPWIHGNTYDLTQKFVVDGNVDWPNASFTKQLRKSTLRLTGNGLPKQTTGVFPVQPGDDAAQIDPNPNRIQAYKLSESIPRHPKYHSIPGCAQGQVGVMTSGAALFAAVDAKDEDAVAHEVQDHCSGHPQESGVYHYHGLPACIGTGKPNKQSKLIGWALDGYPIYGPRGAGGTYLSNDDLDECHGIVSKVNYMGKKRKIFHYVANYEFPYTVGCYRGGTVSSGGGGGGGGPTGPPSGPPAAP
jgi:YHYH protein